MTARSHNTAHLSSPMFSFISQSDGRWKTEGLSDNTLHLYHQYLPEGNTCISLQHCIVTLQSFSVKHWSRCVKHCDTSAELSFAPYSPDRQEHTWSWLFITSLGNASPKPGWLQPQPTAGFPQMKGHFLQFLFSSRSWSQINAEVFEAQRVHVWPLKDADHWTTTMSLLPLSS